jgi:hypothetical protein
MSYRLRPAATTIFNKFNGFLSGIQLALIAMTKYVRKSNSKQLKGENEHLKGENMQIRATLIAMLLTSILGCGSSTDTTTDASGTVGALGNTPDPISVTLPCVDSDWGTYTCVEETIEIPNDRPIYALLVSGFHQNRNLDMFHF